MLAKNKNFIGKTILIEALAILLSIVTGTLTNIGTVFALSLFLFSVIVLWLLCFYDCEINAYSWVRDLSLLVVILLFFLGGWLDCEFMEDVHGISIQEYYFGLSLIASFVIVNVFSLVFAIHKKSLELQKVSFWIVSLKVKKTELYHSMELSQVLMNSDFSNKTDLDKVNELIGLYRSLYSNADNYREAVKEIDIAFDLIIQDITSREKEYVNILNEVNDSIIEEVNQIKEG